MDNYHAQQDIETRVMSPTASYHPDAPAINLRKRKRSRNDLGVWSLDILELIKEKSLYVIIDVYYQYLNNSNHSIRYNCISNDILYAKHLHYN